MTRLQIFKTVLRGRAIYLKLLLSWSTPSIVLFFFIGDDSSDQGRFAASLRSGLAAYSWTLVAFKLGLVAHTALRSYHGNHGWTRLSSRWEDFVLMPFLLASNLLLWVVCVAADENILQSMTLGSVARAALYWSIHG